MSYSKHLKEHKMLRYPDVDANGNLRASVVPRTGTLADLLAISDAGDGEVATATDINAQVIYRDDGAGNIVGYPLYTGRKLTNTTGILATPGGGIAPYNSSTNPDMHPLVILGIQDSYGLINLDAGSGEYRISFPASFSTLKLKMRFTIIIKSSVALDSGVAFQWGFERSSDGGSSWSAVDNVSYNPPASDPVGGNAQHVTSTYPSSIYTNSIYRLSLRHNNSINVQFNGQFELELLHFGADGV